MANNQSDYFRRRAEAEMAIAKAAGAQKATASPDWRTIFIQRRDGTTETVHIREEDQKRAN
jgi:hypothetical protein